MTKMTAESQPGFEVLFLELAGIDSPDRLSMVLRRSPNEWANDGSAIVPQFVEHGVGTSPDVAVCSA